MAAGAAWTYHGSRHRHRVQRHSLPLAGAESRSSGSAAHLGGDQSFRACSLRRVDSLDALLNKRQTLVSRCQYLFLIGEVSGVALLELFQKLNQVGEVVCGPCCGSTLLNSSICLMISLGEDVAAEIDCTDFGPRMASRRAAPKRAAALN